MPSTGGQAHAFKANWVYELPFGRGKKWGSGVSALMDGFIGGWEIDGVARVQSGNKFDYSGYRLVGMTEDEFADMFKFYHVIDPTTLDVNGNPMDRVYMLPQDVIQQSIIALYQTSATTATGYTNNVAADRPVPRAGQRSGLHRVQRGRAERRDLPGHEDGHASGGT